MSRVYKKTSGGQENGKTSAETDGNENENGGPYVRQRIQIRMCKSIRIYENETN